MRVFIVGVLMAATFLGAPAAKATDITACKSFYLKDQYKLALSACNKAAKYDSNAQFYLGRMYGLGRGVLRQSKEAEKWYRKAAGLGHVTAQIYLGIMYLNGFDVARDNKEAAKWFRKAANQGDVYSQRMLGSIYFAGEGIAQDYKESAKWFRHAAKQGDVKSQFNLALMYSKGLGMIRSGAAAADWYYKSGVNYLKIGNKDNALRSVERIKELRDKFHLSVPNMFLADQLLNSIYSGDSKPDKEHTPKTGNNTVSFGTGWAVSRSHIVTNYHVVAGYRKITLLRTDGREIPATVVMYDAVNDLALLKIKSSIDMPKSLQLASKPARIGDKVFTIGYPHPTTMGAKPKLTDGVISSTSGLNDDPRIYQISVPLQSGNSGGPLLNMNGEVVGIVSAKLRALKMFKATGDLPQNVNYAVKAAYLSVLLSTASKDKASQTVLIKGHASLADLADSIKNSIMIVIAE